MLGNLRQTFPYDDMYQRFTVTGKQVQHIFSHIIRAENCNNEGECYKINRGMRAVYDDHLNKLVSLEIKGKLIDARHATPSVYLTAIIQTYSKI